MTKLRRAFDELRLACSDPDFVGNCVSEQSKIIKSTGHEDDGDENRILQGDDAEEASGDVTRSTHSILPEAWIEPLPNALKPSEYMTKMLAAVARESYPTLEQLRFLAVFVCQLDTVKAEEQQEVEWRLRTHAAIVQDCPSSHHRRCLGCNTGGQGSG